MKARLFLEKSVIFIECATVFGGGAMLVALENAVVIGDRGKADVVGNVENGSVLLREQLFALADAQKLR